MSDEPVQNSNDVVVQPGVESTQVQEQDEFVKRKAYEDVSNDMHKYKSKLKEAQATATEYESKLKAIESDQLKKQEKWQELYENERKAKEELEQRSTNEKQRNNDLIKKSALKAALGGSIDDGYLVHAKLNEIEFNDDGTISPESVEVVANKFREDHSVLIPSTSNNNITNRAPALGLNQREDDSLKSKTFEQKAALLANLKK